MVGNDPSSLLKHTRFDRDDDDKTRDDKTESNEGDQEDGASAGGEFSADNPVLCIC